MKRKDFGTSGVEMKSINIAANRLTDAISGINYVLGIAAVETREDVPRIDKDHTGVSDDLSPHNFVLHLEARRGVGLVVVGNANPDERAAVVGDQIHDCTHAFGVFGAPLGRIDLLVQAMNRLSIVPSERNDHDVWIQLGNAHR
ncbi:unannotated protein [freshwater metagenome]|uniref:Unannotated protein n=1 Tax=freshwater metagenome TaxID=449393 RepID=A0A6J6XI49_9ZZZZ